MNYSLPFLFLFIFNSLAYASTPNTQVNTDWYDYNPPQEGSATVDHGPIPYHDESYLPLRLNLSMPELVNILKKRFTPLPELAGSAKPFEHYFSIENEALSPVYNLMTARFNLRIFSFYESTINLHDALAFYIFENNLVTGYCALDILHLSKPQEHTSYTQITQYPQDKKFLKNQLPNVEGRKIHFYRIPRQDGYIERYAFIRFLDNKPYEDSSKKNALVMRAFYPEAVEPLIVSRIQQVLTRHLTVYRTAPWESN